MRLGDTGEQGCLAEIRLAHEADAADIATIHVQSFRATYRGEVPDDFLQGLDVTEVSTIWHNRIEQLTTMQKKLWVASHAIQLSGFCYAGPVAGESGVAMIYSLHVKPENHRSGIGSLLLSTATQALYRSGYSTLELWVVVTNALAISFYEKHGWIREGTRKVDSLSFDGGAQPVVEVVRYRLGHC